ncbi:hypothetical protein BKA67DRAFT_85449 [Truncatella angustata]|uniref:Glycosyl transferase CAP10 domain-containing protein n=1 Tax=Truncatella angustata TaxID=152316 RepID=A0A9P8RGV7_9PEZI|nr:uncharacterized protein BKA67DRAFT_85449 [Truncatella angustata]KAH6645768.1 hypothetical protein BKA67DRAFT_85449 [Truncatella angustata]
MAHIQKPIFIAFSILGLSTAFLSSRYYKSAAFERPFHFSILTLLVTGGFLVVSSKIYLGQNAQFEPLRPSNGHVAKFSNGRFGRIEGTLRSFQPALLSSTPLIVLLLSVICRTVLFWRTIRTIHCSWDGLQTFLPFVVSSYSALVARATILPRNGHEISSRPRAVLPSAYLYILVSLVWGFAATDTLSQTERGTGAICPPGLPERLIPFAQVIMLCCDATILVQIGRVRREWENKYKTWSAIGYLFLLSAAALGFMAFWSYFDRINFRWNLFLTAVSVSDLVLDSIAVSSALVAGVHLLASIEPSTIALYVNATAVLVYLEQRIFDGSLTRAWSNWRGSLAGLVVFLGVGALYNLQGMSSVTSTVRTPFWKSKAGMCSLLAFILVFVQSLFLNCDNVGSDVISRVIVQSRKDSDNWIAGAKTSQSLGEATLEYSRRHGIPPPPNFDKWYEYATSVESPIIDDFTQIHSDLLPYWGVSPGILRERTTHLLTHPIYSFGGLIIEGGKVDISPHIRGTHRWMMEVMQSMIEPFAQWLPDMQLAFNLDDECRVSIPFDRAIAYKADGLKSQARLATHVEFHGFSTSQDLTWEKEFLGIEDEKQREDLWKKESPWFQNWSKSPIFYEWVSSTCPSDALVNQLHWWNRKAECSSCSAPHMTGGILSNWTLSGDLCHQPDLAYLHGFLLSPSAMAATHTMFPVFSQSRMENFADILYPNPWNFGDKVQYDNGKGLAWHQKLNSVYWRGASSDGFAAHGAWQTFMRARFVHMSRRFKSSSKSFLNLVSKAQETLHPSTASSNNSPLTLNVSFVGNFNRCDERDCTAEHTTFYGGPKAEPAPSVDFQEHWKHKHLVDLDGAAFSGRFLPFLKSGSLPYRAALFRTWWEERVHPWRHFVPLDVRLSDFRAVANYLSGKGDKEAETIARDGSEWANKALRKEDMRVYMFRLLLEWGRLVDDRREELGYVSR